ncbi:MAG: hypothetical protein AB7V50_04730, partial [Vampirovibrionia bacterium]
FGIYKLIRWILTFDKPLRNKVLLFLSIAIVVVLLLFFALLFDTLVCLGVLILLIIAGILITLLVWFVKSKYWPFKKKDKTLNAPAGESQNDVSSVNKEDNSHE